MATRLLRRLATLLLAALVISGGFASDAVASTPTLGARSGFAPTSRLLLWGSDADLARDLDLMAASGAGWVRFDFDWPSAEPVRGSFNWTFIDRVVRAARARGLRVLATPAYTPTWARPAGTTDKTPPTDPETFATFVGAAARRYAAMGVRSWEIWNEPNTVHFWQPKPDAARYATLLTAAAHAIRQADPGATIVSGGLAPAADTSDGAYVSPRTFLTQLYAHGAAPSFDAVGMHPYAFPYGIGAVGDWNQFQSMPKTYGVMADNGDSAKKIWATEFGAPTGNNSEAVSEAVQASMVATGWDQWSRWTFTGPIFWYAARDVGTDPTLVEHNFGLVRRDFSPKAALATFTQVLRAADPNPSSSPPPLVVPSDDAGSAGGYWMVAANGRVFAFGSARHLGDAPVGSSPAVDLEPVLGAAGYWVVDGRGAVYAFGAASYLGGNPPLARGESVTSLSGTPGGNGYWLFTTKGRVFAYGDAQHVGDLSDVALNAPVLDSVPTPSGNGYFLVAADGGIFTFGDAVFYGSTGDLRLNALVQSLVPDPDGQGYWLVASDGGIFAFDAEFYGSMGDTRLNRPITGMVSGSSGYLMVAEDGGIFTFGGAQYAGSLGDRPTPSAITSVALDRGTSSR